MKKKTTYFLICNHIIGKREWNPKFADYLFQDGKWVPDTDCKIMDYLMGFDPYEPADSPYGIGNLDIMDKIEEISYEEASRRIEEEKEK